MTTPKQPPLVSVVTPFHNTARYLRECIESVLAQSYENLEFILHDNASNDGSTEIALEYAARDKRIRYFRLAEIVPQVPNYNMALTCISPASVYCKLVQADDWIYGDCLSKMVKVAEISPRVGLVSSFRLEETSVHGEGIPYNQSTMPGHDVARLHLLTWGLFLFGTPTTVMYRSEIVRQRNPFYPLGRNHEDTETCYEIMRNWDFGFVHQVLSFSRSEADSIYGRMRRFDTGVLDRMISIHRYGPVFLSADEFETRRREVERRYYRQMARSVVAFREPEYWEFQREGLETQGLHMDRLKLGAAMLRTVGSLLVCPAEAGWFLRQWTRMRDAEELGGAPRRADSGSTASKS